MKTLTFLLISTDALAVSAGAQNTGSSIGFHVHPEDEAGFVAKGSIILKTRGQTDRIVSAGESFFNIRGAVHSVVEGPDGATVVSTWIVDKSLPISSASALK